MGQTATGVGQLQRFRRMKVASLILQYGDCVLAVMIWSFFA
jgi:hypothetical protein